MAVSPVVWILLGSAAVVLLAGRSRNGRQKNASAEEPKRIDHLHYMEEDEYECPACGARFTRDLMTCPACGARFSGRTEDDTAFIDEMIFWEDEDD